MIIDDAAWKFLSDRQNLEKADHLKEALGAFADAIADKILLWLQQEISKFGIQETACWELRVNKQAPVRYIAFGWKGGRKWPSILRVEFGWNQGEEYGKMPANPWIGVAAPKEVPSKKIQDIVRHLFSGEAILDKRGYPIYDHIKNWPDLWYGHWVDLLPLLESDGRPFLLPLVGQICELARALE